MRVAIIPARGGSKRIPRKNLKNFCGSPIVSYSIRAAQECGLFEKVVVTTDDREVAEVARLYGAEVPFIRPSELSGDYTTTVPVIRHAVDWLNCNTSSVSFACCIYATAPFVQARYIREAFRKLVDGRVTGYVFSAAPLPFPIQRAFRVVTGGFVRMFHPEHYSTRSQDLEPAYQDAGQFYWGSAQAFLDEKIFFSDDSKAIVLPKYLVQDIDTLEDWRRAELMYESLRLAGELV